MNDKVNIKPSLSDYKDLYKKMPAEIDDLLSDIDSHPEVNIETLNINYSQLFELDFQSLVMLFLTIFADNLSFDLNDKDEVIRHFLKPNDFIENTFSSFKYEMQSDENFDKQDAIILLSILMNLLMAIFANIRSISIYESTNSINQLIANARDKNDSESLFKAISIDRTCLSTPTAQKAITKATLTNDLEFFDKLSRGVKGSRPHNQKPEFDIVRFMDALINGWKNKKPFSNEEICHIFINDLKIYPSTGKDDFAGLTRFLQRIRKRAKTT